MFAVQEIEEKIRRNKLGIKPCDPQRARRGINKQKEGLYTLQGLVINVR